MSDLRDFETPIETRIRADMEALRTASHPGLRSPADTLRALRNPSTQGKGMTLHNTKKRWLPAALALAILLIAGVVFAATATDLFSVWVDTDGKTDQEVEDEIQSQLVDQGVNEPEVEFRRNDNMTKVDIAGAKDGREFHIVQKRKGDDGSGVVMVQPPMLDTERDPGMTDADLEAKIRAQMEQLGLEGTVKVQGDDVQIRVERREHGDQAGGNNHGRQARD